MGPTPTWSMWIGLGFFFPIQPWWIRLGLDCENLSNRLIYTHASIYGLFGLGVLMFYTIVETLSQQEGEDQKTKKNNFVALCPTK